MNEDRKKLISKTIVELGNYCADFCDKKGITFKEFSFILKKLSQYAVKTKTEIEISENWYKDLLN